MSMIVDFFILLFVCGVVFEKSKELSIFIFLVNLMFYFQFGQTLLLLGEKSNPVKTNRKVKAAFLSLVLVTPIALLFGREVKESSHLNMVDIWNNDLFPVFLGVCLLSGLAIVSLFIEKRKR